MMAERVAAVLERRADDAGRFEQLAQLLDDPQHRIELEDYLEQAIQRESGDVAAKMYARTRFYAELVKREGKRLKGADQQEAIETLSTELPSILAAAKRALDKDATDLLLAFSTYIREFMEKTGRWNEALTLYEHMIDSARRSEFSDHLLSSLLGYGVLLFGLSRFSEAQNAMNEARSLAHDMGDERSEAGAINTLGNIACQLGRFDEAIQLHEQSLAMRRKMGVSSFVSDSLCNLATTWQIYGVSERAIELYEECLAIDRESGDRHNIAITSNNLGNLALDQGRHSDARRCYKECLAICREIGDQHGCAMAIGNLGNLALREDDLNKAEPLIQEALEVNLKIDDKQGIAICTRDLGHVALRQRRYGQAKELLEKCVALYEETEEQLNAASAKSYLAVISIIEEQFSPALSYLCSSLQIESQLSRFNSARVSIIAAGTLLLRLGQLQQAGVLMCSMRYHFEKQGRFLTPIPQDLFDDSLAQLAESLPAPELENIEREAEAMSLEELTEYALKALAELRPELGEPAGEESPAPLAADN